jgi:hypothetical protein
LHSFTRLYWPADEVSRVAAAIEEAAVGRPLAYVTMEYPTAPTTTSSAGAELTVRL